MHLYTSQDVIPPASSEWKGWVWEASALTPWLGNNKQLKNNFWASSVASGKIFSLIQPFFPCDITMHILSALPDRHRDCCCCPWAGAQARAKSAGLRLQLGQFERGRLFMSGWNTNSETPLPWRQGKEKILVWKKYNRFPSVRAPFCLALNTSH